MVTFRALIVGGSVLVTLAVGAQGGTSVAATIRASTASRDAYVKALMPFAEAALASTFSPSVDDRSCFADQLVESFTLRRLRAVGSPAQVRREFLSDDSKLEQFGITEAQLARVGTTALWECFGVGRVVDRQLRHRGAQLSQSSIECLDAKFDSDPKAENAYIEASIRVTNNKPKGLTAGLYRSGIIFRECLTPEELAEIRG